MGTNLARSSVGMGLRMREIVGSGGRMEMSLVRSSVGMGLRTKELWVGVVSGWWNANESG